MRTEHVLRADQDDRSKKITKSSLTHLLLSPALAAILTIITCTLGVAPTLPENLKGDVSAPFPIIKPEGIPAAIGVFCFAYVCQHNILLNYKSLKNSTEKRFATVARVSIGVTVLLTVAIGMAFLTFREKSKSNILNNFPSDNVVISVCRILFGKRMPVVVNESWKPLLTI